jgi:hypothetical protein
MGQAVPKIKDYLSQLFLKQADCKRATTPPPWLKAHFF